MHQDQVARNTLTATHTRHKGNALFTNYHGLISNRAKDNKVLCFVVGLAEGHVDFQRPLKAVSNCEIIPCKLIISDCEVRERLNVQKEVTCGLCQAPTRNRNLSGEKEVKLDCDNLCHLIR